MVLYLNAPLFARADAPSWGFGSVLFVAFIFLVEVCTNLVYAR